MTTQEPTSSVESGNPFEAPKSDLTDISSDKPILELQRFSAWAVVGLSIITLGIYIVYWIYSRAKITNSLSKINKISMKIVGAFIVVYIANIVSSVFVGDNKEIGMIEIFNMIVTLAYLVLYIMTVFGLRKVISEIINEGTVGETKLGGILTFFFSAIYFQYKINEAIDLQSNNQDA